MERTRFSFNSAEHQLVESLESTQIIMYWEISKEVCPHCKEIITKGEHVKFDTIEIWIPITTSVTECTKQDLIMLGKNANNILLLTKDKMEEVLKLTNKFQHLKEVT